MEGKRVGVGSQVQRVAPAVADVLDTGDTPSGGAGTLW